MMAIDAIEEIDPATLTEADAAAANYPYLGQLRAMARPFSTKPDSMR